ncbi:Gfo/Idh/MocA family protein [Occultella gossypii]|uniref:Gfo/Idh/MocA family oxidoreductase n=1 Tax=Occultella gossypii TaxID=2800820 RepID=A0ABS7S2V2_9MICO|nr:Gfo/Idh/MocA family oxidoreductase [Occultella gossypii]MBZ2194670.1 Gfo/Idh/MocA family oxidoreductase [Occultella gossypii]
MNDSPRLVILGVAHWHTERQVAAFARAGAQFVAVQDDDPHRGERWGRELGCPAHTDVSAALDGVAADLVLVLSPNDDVPGVVRLLLDRGLPFAVEKPAGVSAPSLRALCDEAERLGTFTAVAFVNRYSGFWPEVDRLRGRGTITGPVAARFRIVNGTPARYPESGVPWVLSRQRFGGGALRNIGAHAADSAVRLLGPQIDVIGARTSSSAYGLDVEDYAVALLSGRDGSTVTIEAGYVHPNREGTDHEWSLACPGAMVVESDSVLHVTTAQSDRDVATPDMSGRYDQFAAETVAALREGQPSRTPLRTALRALDLVDRIYAASTTSPSPT